MATSGGNFNQHPEFSAQIGRQTEKKSQPGFFERVGLARLIVTGLEIAAGVIAAPFTGGSTLAAVATDVAIATAGSAAQIAIDVSRGETSLTGTIINVASPFLAGGLSFGSSVLKDVRLGYKVAREVGNETLGGIHTSLEKFGNQFTKIENFSTNIPGVGKFTETLTRTPLSTLSKRQLGNLFRSTGGNLAGGAAGISGESVKALENLKIGVETIFGSNAIRAAGTSLANDLDDALAKIGVSAARIENIVNLIGKLSEKEIAAGAIGDLLIRELTSSERAALAANNTIKASVLKAAEDVPKEVESEIKSILGETKQDWKSLKGQFKSIKEAKGAREKTRAIKNFFGSREFNDLGVQNVQLITDPRDLGRAPIEFSYRLLKRYFNKFFSKFKGFVKYAERIKKLQGFIPVDSFWILGYRILSDEFAGKFVAIYFDPETTNRKPPVFTWMTTTAITRFTLDPGRYYYKHIARKALGFGNPIANAAFGIVPTGLLKNVTSLASNISQFIEGNAKGTWAARWKSAFAGSFSRNWKNRLSRLTGRVLIGGAASAIIGRRLGNFIGREAQRVGSQIVLPSMRGQKVDYAKTFMTSLNSVGRRRLRKKGSAVSGALGIKRQLGLATRPISSFTAGHLSLNKIKIKF